MFENLKFAPPIKPLHTTDISVATAFVTGLKVTPKIVSAANIIANPDGMLSCNGEFHKVTEFGFESFCKMLGIPASFARKIPQDLLFDNIRRLTESQPDLDLAVLFRDNGEIAGVCKPPYIERSYADVLAVFAEKNELSYVNVSEDLMTLGFWYENRIIPKSEDDALHVGTYVYSSILKSCKVHAFSGLYRSSCENSFVMPFFGKVNANYKEEDNMLLRFAELLQCFDATIYERFQRDFAAFNMRKLFDTEISSIWKSAHRTISSSEIDSFFEFTEDERKTLMTTVQTRFVENKRARLVGAAVEESTPTNIMAYDILNKLTSHARKNLFGSNKLAIEKLAGTWVGKIILN